MTRLVCTADNHIGRGVRGAITPERLAEQEQILRDTLELARERQVDAVLHGGDLFHDRRPTPAVMLAAERPLVEHRDAGGPPVVMVNGNHCVSGTAESAAIDVFAEAGLIELYRRPGRVHVGGVTVACLPWSSTARIVAAAGGDEDRDDVNQVAAGLLLEVARGLRAETAGPCVLLSHFAVEGAALPSGLSIDLAREPILPVADLEAVGFDAVVLGHIHRPQFLDDARRVFYCGPPMPLDFGDTGSEYGCWLLEIDNDPLVEFLPIDSRRFVTLDVDYTHTPDDVVGDIGLWPDTKDDVADSFVKLRVRATEEQARRIDANDLRAAFTALGAHNVWIEPTIVREVRARVQGLDESVSDTDALEAWLDSQGVNGSQAPALRSLHGDYLAEVGDAR